MKRRTLVTSLGAIPVASVLAGIHTSNERSINSEGVTFQWRHADGRLHTTLAAPTTGWIAVGFNNAARFEGSRFVIAHVGPQLVRAEVHAAIVPGHLPIERLGGVAGLDDVHGTVRQGISTLQFSLAEQHVAPYQLNLSAGQFVQLFLAWSQEADFAHHSAWRRHFDITI